jgi:hypothetical protein
MASHPAVPSQLLRFPPGRIVSTPGALQAFRDAKANPLTYLARHVSGDWGEVSEEDRVENELSVREGFRILSAYVLSTNERVWIITEADRSVTTFLLPSEY